jgi:signal transduction histidine kinase
MGEMAQVLIIDDETRRAAALEAALTAAGYRVRVVSNLAEAQEAAAAQTIDAVLCAGQAVPPFLAGETATSSASTSNGLQVPIAAVNEVPIAAVNEGVLAKLTSESVRVQEEERRKLSLELHDDVIQVMGTLVLMMDACLVLAPEDATQLRKYLLNAQETARDGFHRVQRICVNLRPPILDDLGLAPTILWYAERFTQETGIPVEVAMREGLPPLSGDQETALFRIVQQALQNVRQHAQARRVDISVESRPGTLRVAVSDDGIGVDQQQLNRKTLEGTHLGLAGMRYRAGILGGTFEISSTGGSGTTVVAEIPVQSGPRGDT